MNKHNLKVGDKLYVAHKSMFFDNFQNLLTIVQEVGKTVIYTDIGTLDIETLQHKKNRNYFIFLTDEDRKLFYDTMQLQDRIKSMLTHYNYGKYTHEQLTQIENILKS
jgi:hypothetical protein